MNNMGNNRDVALLALPVCKLCSDNEQPDWLNWTTNEWSMGTHGIRVAIRL